MNNKFRNFILFYILYIFSYVLLAHYIIEIYCWQSYDIMGIGLWFGMISGTLLTMLHYEGVVL